MVLLFCCYEGSKQKVRPSCLESSEEEIVWQAEFSNYYEKKIVRYLTGCFLQGKAHFVNVGFIIWIYLSWFNAKLDYIIFIDFIGWIPIFCELIVYFQHNMIEYLNYLLQFLY